MALPEPDIGTSGTIIFCALAEAMACLAKTARLRHTNALNE